jgi:hypothetical protein
VFISQAVEIIDPLRDNFVAMLQMHLLTHILHLRHDIPEELQAELTELQCDFILRGSLNHNL